MPIKFFLIVITFLAIHIFYSLLLILILFLQHEHVLSFVKKNNAHNEHPFSPILHLKLLDDGDFRRSHIPFTNLCYTQN